MKTYPQNITHNPGKSFGSPLIGRTYTADTLNGYRFGFNGKEKTDEIYGDGNGMDYGARISDTRLGGRWFSVDPLSGKYPSHSPFISSLNNPIRNKDIDGEDVWVGISATTADYCGHASITVTNYKEVAVKIKGKMTIVWIKDGYKTYDLTPKKEINGNVLGGYQSTNTAPSENDDATFKVNEIQTYPEQKTAIGKEQVEYFTTAQIQSDLNVKTKLENLKSADKEYSVVDNNCVDLVTQGLSALDTKYMYMGKENLKSPFPLLISDKSVSTPNKLATKLKESGANIIKYNITKLSFKTQNFINKLDFQKLKDFITD